MSAPHTYEPPSLESMLDARKREGFFEFAHGMAQTRGELSLWRLAAFDFGTETTVERRERTDDCYGKIVIARDLVIAGGDDAITHACLNLAKKMRAQFGAPTEETGTP